MDGLASETRARQRFSHGHAPFSVNSRRGLLYLVCVCVCGGGGGGGGVAGRLGKEKKGVRGLSWEAFVYVISMQPPSCHAGFGLLVITHKISFASCVCTL